MTLGYKEARVRTVLEGGLELGAEMDKSGSERALMLVAAQVSSAADRVAWERPVVGDVSGILRSSLLRHAIREPGRPEDERESRERLMSAGRTWIDRRIGPSASQGSVAGGHFVGGVRSPRPEVSIARILGTWERLSPLERRVARLMAMKFLPEDIGILLQIPPESVNLHHQQACRKIREDYNRLFQETRLEEHTDKKEIVS